MVIDDLKQMFGNRLPRYASMLEALEQVRIGDRRLYAAVVTAVGQVSYLLPQDLIKADEEFVMLQPRIAANSRVSGALIPGMMPLHDALGWYSAQVGTQQLTLEDFFRDWKACMELLYAKYGTLH